MSLKMSLNPELAREFINIVGEIVDEIRLIITMNGIKVSAVDPANVALIILDLPKDNFLSYEFEASDNWTSSIDGHYTGVLQENIAVGIDVLKIKEFLDISEGEVVLIEELRDPVEFTFSVDTLEMRQGMFYRKIKLLPENSIRKAPKIPMLHLDYKVQLDTLEFMRITKKAAKVSDYIMLGFSREDADVIFTARASDGDELPWQATKHMFNWQCLRDDARLSSSSLFLLDYLVDIMPKIPSDKVWLHIGQDYPCKLSFVLGQTGTVEYLQAPRIEGD